MKDPFKQAWLVALLFIATLGFVKHATRAYGLNSELAYAAAIAIQLYVPIMLIRKEDREVQDYRLYFYGILERGPIQWRALQTELVRVAWLSLLTLPAFGLLFYGCAGLLAGRPLGFSFALPPNWPMFVASQVLLVALPEEFFYRGFIQTRFLQRWPNQHALLGIPIGSAVTATSALFALGHFVGEYDPARLAPFFPAYLFSYLVFRSPSILGAVVFHALCNVFVATLRYSLI